MASFSKRTKDEGRGTITIRSETQCGPLRRTLQSPPHPAHEPVLGALASRRRVESFFHKLAGETPALPGYRVGSWSLCALLSTWPCPMNLSLNVCAWGTRTRQVQGRTPR